MTHLVEQLQTLLSQGFPETNIGLVDLEGTQVRFIPSEKEKSAPPNPLLRLIETTLNPLAALSFLTQVQRRGVSPKSKAVKGREVDPRFFGVLCPLDTPESEKIGIVLHLARDAVVENGRVRNIGPLKDWEYTRPLACKLPDGRYLIASLQVEEKEEHDSAAGNQTEIQKQKEILWKRYPVRWTLRIGTDAEAQDALLIPEDYAGFLGFAALLVPFIQHNDGARAMMGAKNAKQALSPIQAEPPLVQTGYEKEIARLYLDLCRDLLRGDVWNHEREIYTLEHQEVVDAKNGDERNLRVRFKARYQNKFREFNDINLSRGYVSPSLKNPPPYLRAVRVAGFPAVEIQPREKVLQEDPFFNLTGIQDGVLALGVNALVGYLPFFGYNFEDAIVVSQSFAERMTTRHIYTLAIPPGWKIQGLPESLRIDLKKGEITGFRETTGDGKEVARSLRLPPELRSGRNHKILGVFKKDSPLAPWEVWIQVEKPLQVGDKLTGRHGNKGVISRILPDDQMPYFELDGERRHLEVILNPHGVVSRMNLGQILETHVGFVVQRLREMGREDEVQKWQNSSRPFHRIDLDELSHALQETGLDEKGRIPLHVQDLDHPEIRGTVKAVVGYQYLLRLAHLPDEKITARGVGRRRTLATGQPPKGRKHEGGQRVGEMETWALLAHGAVNTLRELLFEASDAQSKGFQKTRKLQERYNPGALEAFRDLLLGAFVSLEDPSSRSLRIRHLEDDEFKESTAAEKIETLASLLATDPGDEKINRFGYIELPEDLGYIHPWFIPQLFPGNRYRDLRKLLKGEAYLIREDDAWKVKDRAQVPSEKLRELYNRKHVKVGIKAARTWLKEHDPESVGKLDRHIHRILPVIPYRYRLYCQTPWELYREASSGTNLERMGLTAFYARILLDLQKQGRGRKPPEIEEKDPAVHRNRKILRHIALLFDHKLNQLLFSKEGILRGYLLGKRIDRSGRAVIVPDPKVPPDTILIPSEIREALFQGLGRRRDLKVLLNRQPTLHRYSIFSFRHRKSPDHTLHISPLICAPYNADFDGDTMAVYLPVSREAQKELESMTFLKHWKSLVTGKPNLHIAQDIKLGLKLLEETLETLPKENTDLWIRTHEELLRVTCAKEIGELKELLSDSVRLIEHLQLQVLPEAMKSRVSGEILLAERLRDLAHLAFRAATFSGVTFSIFELRDLQGDFIRHLHNHPPEKDDFDGLKEHLKTWLEGWTKSHFNSPALLVRTGARGKPEQLLQMIWGRKLPHYWPKSESGKAPHLQVDSPEGAYATPLLAGHSPLEYFALAFTTRLTMTDKKLNVAHAGYLTRKLVHAGFELRVAEEDCGSTAPHRSPLTCESPNGVCLACLGEVGKDLRVGDFIGVLAATSVGERGTQLSMQTFHTADPNKISNLDELSQMLTRGYASRDEACEVIRDLREGRGKDLYGGIRPSILAAVFRARLQDEKVLGYREAVNRGDLFARMAFEEGKNHIARTLGVGREYEEEVRSILTRLFALGEAV